MFVLGERTPLSRSLFCQFVVWSVVKGKMWSFIHDMQVVGRVSQEVVRYRSDSIGKRSVDEKVVVYSRGSFVNGVVQTRAYCSYLFCVKRPNINIIINVNLYSIKS